MAKIIDISDMKASNVTIESDDRGGVRLEIDFEEDYPEEMVKAYVEHLIRELGTIGIETSDSTSIRYQGENIEFDASAVKKWQSEDD